MSGLHYNDLPDEEKTRLQNIAAYLKTETVSRMAPCGVNMHGAILDVVLTGSFANGVAVGEGHDRSDYDLIIVSSHTGYAGDIFYTVEDTAPPEEVEAGKAKVKRILSNLYHLVQFDYPDLEHALNASLRGYDNLWEPFEEGKILGISLIDGAVFDTKADFYTHHGLS